MEELTVGDMVTRHVPNVNAFVAVSDANANVFFYKHAAGKGQATEGVVEKYRK